MGWTVSEPGCIIEYCIRNGGAAVSMNTVLFVGGTAPRHPDLDSMFEKTSAYLQNSDLLFGQLEAVVTDHLLFTGQFRSGRTGSLF